MEITGTCSLLTVWETLIQQSVNIDLLVCHGCRPAGTCERYVFIYLKVTINLNLYLHFLANFLQKKYNGFVLKPTQFMAFKNFF